MTSTFKTLPENLILQLKRFKVTPSMNIVKRFDSVNITPEIEVPTELNDRHYKLVSAIVHSGLSMHAGHYRSFGLDLEQKSGRQWLCYDDDIVKPRSTEYVQEKLKKSSYILFYQKQKQNEGERSTRTPHPPA
ncbi:ubiquitin carboxyl-terminal hydrolase 46-like isoform X2 [Antennarius striatus]|uniref:ubiquitin carboxyl-terminal hydrolase 46-like isoform X2 n=1 Tax=Antennarius striatus TaxID=241820 RepID=UPI0035B2FEB1